MSQYKSSITGTVFHDIRYIDNSLYDLNAKISNIGYNNTSVRNTGSQQVSFSSTIKKFSSKSIYIKNDNLAILFPTTVSLPSNFTISWWMYIQKYPTVEVSSNNNHVAGMQVYSSGVSAPTSMNLYLSWNDNNINNQGFEISQASNSYLSKRSASHPSLNTWHHAAFVRSSSNCYWFIDGVLRESGSCSYNQNVNGISLFGRRGSEVYYDDICLIKGQGLWTSNFTVPNNYLTGVKTPKRIHNNHKIFPFNRGQRSDYYDKAFIY